MKPTFFGTLLVLLTVSCARNRFSQTASAQDTLRVMTYNIHHANPPSRPGFIDLDAVAKVIQQQRPDVVYLQEVDVLTGRSKIDEAALLAEKTGMQVYFAKAIDYDGGAYGNALLSRYPLKNTATRRLPTAEGTKGEPRVLATAEIEVKGKTITLACTHLDAQRSDTNRMLQIRALAAFLKEEKHPVLLGGDLNAEPGSNVIGILDQHFSRTCSNACGFTIPVDVPRKTIDFIAFAPARAFAVVSHAVIDEQYASDHLPVVATLQ
ncbi:MAG TPA: endonuclease/exonuclease/phosphatase family protein, partial [Chitinophagaceae bacterium]|nr:endonuclease/exonuclease/phosphatase family protein [Chitinophagaceae bacterium]